MLARTIMGGYNLEYVEKLRRRNQRIPGFVTRFLIPRFLKSLPLLASVPLLIRVAFLRQCRTVLYRPNPRNLTALSRLRGVLVIGGRSEREWARENGFGFLPFYPLYALSNFGIGLAWRLIYNVARPKRLLVWTDYGLEHYIGIRLARRYGVRSWCVQHGLFPVENNSDLDGMHADVNVVSSGYQRDILLASGYGGKVVVCDEVFGERILQLSLNSMQSWSKSGKKVVFVGAGYIHDPHLEDSIFRLVKVIRQGLDRSHTLIYRPHPRDAGIKTKLRDAGVTVVSGHGSAIENDENFVFVGIKSTYLLEAQNVGKLVFLIRGEEFPSYFHEGEIRNEISTGRLSMLGESIRASIERSGLGSQFLEQAGQ